MPNVYIHASTKKQLDSLVLDLPQSIVLTGPFGVGLRAAAEYIATSMDTDAMYVLPEKDDKQDIEKGVITINIIRRLYVMTKTIEPKSRLIVIDYAERMGIQAQNAFLKLLEEPNAHTHFVLLTHSVAKLLPTVRSRVQLVDIRPITQADSQSLLDRLHVTNATKRTQLLFIASGLPALLSTLASDDTAFEKRINIIKDARTLLQGTTYDRLKLALAYKDDRITALTLLTDAMKLLQGALKSGQQPNQVKKISLLLKAHERIEANGNIRLQLAAAML